MCAGSAIFSKTYELQIVKNKVTPDEIMNDYIPNVTYNGETVENGQEIFGSISLPGSTSYMDIVLSLIHIYKADRCKACLQLAYHRVSDPFGNDQYI